jgi:hypothetical protein
LDVIVLPIFFVSAARLRVQEEHAFKRNAFRRNRAHADEIRGVARLPAAPLRQEIS